MSELKTEHWLLHEDGTVVSALEDTVRNFISLLLLTWISAGESSWLAGNTNTGPWWLFPWEVLVAYMWFALWVRLIFYSVCNWWYEIMVLQYCLLHECSIEYTIDDVKRRMVSRLGDSSRTALESSGVSSGKLASAWRDLGLHQQKNTSSKGLCR